MHLVMRNQLAFKRLDSEFQIDSKNYSRETNGKK